MLKCSFHESRMQFFSSSPTPPCMHIYLCSLRSVWPLYVCNELR